MDLGRKAAQGVIKVAKAYGSDAVWSAQCDGQMYMGGSQPRERDCNHLEAFPPHFSWFVAREPHTAERKNEN
jgi:hypothetical protein